MKVHIRLFAVLREHAGTDAIEVDLADGATVADAMQVLAESGPLADTIRRLPVAMAVNREFGTEQTRLEAGDELALIPPLSGGSGMVGPTEDGDSTGESGHRNEVKAATPGATPTGESARLMQIHARIIEEPLLADALIHAVGRPSAGAIVVFCGVTRDVECLEYEAYREMAQEKLVTIGRECAASHALQAIAIEHRLGRVALGEPSVIVASSAAHRKEAFAGTRDAIDRIKAQAPIWKREVCAEGGARWVRGTPAPYAKAAGGHMPGDEIAARERAR